MATRQTDRLCRYFIDDQLEFRRLLNRQVGWLFALEDPADLNPARAGGGQAVGSIANQTSVD
jgi:hypothetical protein